ncbi:gluconolactonase [Lachnospiraceae bacterium 29-91]
MKRQENRAVIAWRGAASAGLVSSADRAYMKAPVPRPTPDFRTKCPELVYTLTKKQTGFSLKIEMGGKPF